MRILIVDDHVVVRKGVMDILCLSFADAVFVEASTSAEALACLDAASYDLVILDISLPDEDGFKTLERIRRVSPDQAVLVLSMHTGAGYVVEAFKLGANGYLSKGSVPEEMLDAVNAVLAGDRYVPQNMAGDLVHALLPKPGRTRLEDLLSEREYEVIVRLARGEKVMDIASAMDLSDKTVSTYRARAMRKLGIKNMPQFVKFAMAMGLMDS